MHLLIFCRAKQRIRRKGTIHVYIRNINQGDHIASFPPGRVLHMEFTKNAKPLYVACVYILLCVYMHVYHDKLSDSEQQTTQ